MDLELHSLKTIGYVKQSDSVLKTRGTAPVASFLNYYLRYNAIFLITRIYGPWNQKLKVEEYHFSIRLSKLMILLKIFAPLAL